MTDRKENFEVLKRNLGRLTFARVGTVIAKEEDLIAFVNKSGVTTWGDEPDFTQRRNEFTSAEWQKTERNYKYYFGFANNIYFQSKTQSDDSGFCGLGVSTRQNRLEPLPVGTWIVGNLDQKASKPRFRRWAQCTFGEKLFVDFMLGKMKLSLSRSKWMEQVALLFTNEEPSTNRLANLVVLLILRDLEYFLDERKKHGDSVVDYKVFEICSEYDLDLWHEYRAKVIAQGIYSTAIPKPAPRTTMDTMVKAQVPLCTPFAGLEA